MKNLFTKILLIWALAFSLMIPGFKTFAAIRYIDSNGTGSGTSWEDASGNLQAMMDASAAGDSVWVKGGTYKPVAYPTGCTDCSHPRDYAFRLKSGVKVFGSFSGNENSFGQRTADVIAKNQSILTGYLGFFGNFGGVQSALHVVLSVRDNSNTLLNGFTISGGFAYAYPDEGTDNITIMGNSAYSISKHNGAGLYAHWSDATFENIIFDGNAANGSTAEGGAAYIETAGNPKFINSTFHKNSAGYLGGGAIAISSNAEPSGARISNCIFINNRNAIKNYMPPAYSSSPNVVIFNSTFYKNPGVFISNSNSSIGILNSIFWDNEYSVDASAMGSQGLIQYSTIQNGYTGTGNISTDPLFVGASTYTNTAILKGPDGFWNTNDDLLQLQHCSSSANAGINTIPSPFFGTLEPNDIKGFERIQYTEVDMGAHEFGAGRTTDNCVGSSAMLLSSPGDSYAWAGPNGFSSTSQNPVLSNLTSADQGVYTVTVSSTVCTTTATVYVTVFEIPAAPVITPPASNEICAPGTLTYTATCASGFVTWHDGSMASGFTVNGVGTYSISATCTANGCPSPPSSSITAEIKAKPSVPSIISPSSLTICIPDSLTFKGSCTLGDITWNDNSVLDSLTFNGVSTYSISALCSSNGCDSDASTGINAEIKAKPAVAEITSPEILSVCSPETVTISASCLSGTVVWSDESTGNSITLNTIGVYTVSAQCLANGCISDVSEISKVEIKEKPAAPVIVLRTNAAVCSPDSLILTASCASGILKWGDNSTNDSLIISAVGSYTITATCSLNGCQSDVVSSQSLEVKAKPIPFISNNSPLSEGDTLKLTSSGGTGYLWAGPNGFSSGISNPMKPSVLTADSGIYTVTVSENGCSSSASTNVEIGIKIRYIKPVATGLGDGSSWANASGDLQAMIDSSDANNEIWVRGGTYAATKFPTGSTGGTSAKDYAFLLKNKVRIYGGFSGTESSLNERTPAVRLANPSIISGQNGISDDLSDNKFHLVISVNNDNSTVFNGFTLTRANMVHPGNTITIETYPIGSANGGGFYTYKSSPVIENCIFINNGSGEGQGAGLFNYWSSPTIDHCVFEQNAAGTGGAIYSTVFCNPVFKNATFINNIGSTISNSGSSVPVISNCNFIGNQSIYNGAVLFSNNNSNGIEVVNSTFLNNANSYSGLVSNYSSSLSIKNSIIWGNQGSFGGLATISNSILEGVTPYSGNIDVNPRFTNVADLIGPDGIWNTSDDGLTLEPCSEAINAGSNSDVIGNTDITGEIRIQNTTVDLGAYESPFNAGAVITASPVITPPTQTNICAPGTLTISGTCPSGTLIWSDGTSGPSLSISSPGIYRISAVCKDNLCTSDSSATYVLGIYETPVPTINEDISVCQYNNVNLTSSGGETYNWTGPNGFSSSDQNVTISSPLSNQSGIYSVTVSNPGCSAIATTEVIISAMPNAPYYTFITGGVICQPDSFMIKGVCSTGSILWSDGSTNDTLILKTPDTYAVFGFCILNNCSSYNSSVYNIEIKEPLATPVITAGGALEVCIPNTVQLSATCEAGSIAWSNGTTGSITTVSQPGTYDITAVCIDGGCTSLPAEASHIVITSVPSAPTITLVSQSTVCAPDNLEFSGSCFTGTILWNDNSTNSTLTINDVGSYTISATCVLNDCESEPSEALNGQINAKPASPVVTAPSETQICSPGSLTLTASCAPGAFIVWSTNTTGNTLTLTQAGDYSITASCLFDGCTSDPSSPVELSILQAPSVVTNSPVCPGGLLILNASGGDTYAWSHANGFSSSLQNLYISNAGATDAGTYTVTITNAVCSRTLEVPVNISPYYTTIYVNDDATGANDGSSWSNAFTDLQSALQYSCYDTIWVAGGTYFPSKDPSGNPNPANIRDKTFLFTSNKVIFGSFAGTETALSQRDTTVIRLNPSILSGDLGVIKDDSDNAYHVAATILNGSGTVFNGFTIEYGNANGSGPLTLGPFEIYRNAGGGMISAVSSATFENFVFRNNKAVHGAGMYNQNGSQYMNQVSFKHNMADSTGGGLFNVSSSPTITNASFISNSATLYGGGGMANAQSSPMIDKSIFKGNSGRQGGGIGNAFGSSPTVKNSFFIQNSASFAGGGFGTDGTNGGSAPQPQLINCVFTANTSQSYGGAIANNYAFPSITNTTIFGNTAGQFGGGVFNTSSSNATITNTILYANSANFGGSDIMNLGGLSTVTYSSTQTTITGTGNVTGQNPNFANYNLPEGSDGLFWTSDDGFVLNSNSPLLDIGTSSGATATDILGNVRPTPGTVVDLGAYETPSVSEPTNIVASQTTTCIYKPFTISASCESGFDPVWYIEPSNGTALFTGSPYNTSLGESTAFYVACESGGIKSARVAAQEITVYPNPPAPTADATQNYCSGATIADLQATGSNLKWSENKVVKQPIDLLINSPDYRVTQTVNGCTSLYAFVEVVLTTAPVPVISASPTQIGAGASSLLTASACTGTVTWSPGGATGTSLMVSPTITTIYSATCMVNGCESESSESVEVTVSGISPCASLVQLQSVADDISSGTTLISASAQTGKIQASNKIQGTANVSFKAPSIELNAGFEAKAGTVFRAEIGGCN